MVDINALFGVIGLAFSLTLGTELIQYFLIYRTPSFRALKANVEKQAAKVEVARDASTSKSLKKNQAKLTSWEEECGKKLAAVNMKSGAIVSPRDDNFSILFFSLKYNLNKFIFGFTAHYHFVFTLITDDGLPFPRLSLPSRYV